MRANPVRERPPEFWVPRVELFFSEFEDLFDVGVRGAETRRHGREYLSGLLLPLPEEVRKNTENLADRFPIPAHRLYQFLAYSPWDYRLVQERLARVMGAAFAHPRGVLDTRQPARPTDCEEHGFLDVAEPGRPFVDGFSCAELHPVDPFEELQS